MKMNLGVCGVALLLALVNGIPLAAELNASRQDKPVDAGGVETVVPDERDKSVLDALFAHLLDDPDFNLNRVPVSDGTIVVHEHTPQKTGFIQSSQMRHDTGDNPIPTDAMKNLQARNSVPGTFDAVEASYKDVHFTAAVVVADLSGFRGGRGFYKEFRKVTRTRAHGWSRIYRVTRRMEVWLSSERALDPPPTAQC